MIGRERSRHRPGRSLMSVVNLQEICVSDPINPQHYVLLVEGPLLLRPLSNDRCSILALLPVGENQDHVVQVCSSSSHPVLRSHANPAVESRDISDRFVGRPWLRYLYPPGTKTDHLCDLVGASSDDLMMVCQGTASGEKCHFFRFACSPAGRTAGNSYLMKDVFTIGAKSTSAS
jgi:hypothetical protein